MKKERTTAMQNGDIRISSSISRGCLLFYIVLYIETGYFLAEFLHRRNSRKVIIRDILKRKRMESKR